MEINEGGAQNDKNEFWRSPAVEKDAEQEYGNILELPGHQIIGDQKHRKKAQQEYDTAKNHFVLIIVPNIEKQPQKDSIFIPLGRFKTQTKWNQTLSITSSGL